MMWMMGFVLGGALLGDWMTPGGSVVRVAGCGEAICVTVVKVGPAAKGTKDVNNPNSALRERPICGMQVAEGLRAKGESAAEDGTIYDPESGKTYRAKMERKGDELRLRGFVGVSLFGRTETWKKVGTVEACR